MDALTRLQGIYFFEHLSPEEMAALAAVCRIQRCVAGDDVLKQGEQTNHFYIVDEGHVNLRHTDRGGFERPIGSKGPGEFFGIKMFTTQEPSEYTFEAVDAANTWVIDREAWDKLVETNPDILDHMPELRAEYARLTRGLDWLSPGEVIDLTTRRHWWALVLMIRLPLIVALIFTVAYGVSNFFGVTNTLPQVLYVFVGVLGLVLLWLIWEGLNWYNDTYIVTNKRVVRINKVLFFSDSRQDLAIEKIQSQRVDRGGPISVLLNISDLRITSAASETEGVIFEQVGDVLRIQKAIENERLHVAERNRASERERLRRQIAGEIQHYVFQQPSVPEAAPRTRLAIAPSNPLRFRLPLLWRRAKRTSKPVPLNKRVGGAMNSLFGTEMRDGNLVTWRKHHIVLLQQIFPGVGAFVVILLMTVFFVTSGVPFNLANNGIFAVLLILLLAAFGYIAWEWEDWRRDLYKLSAVDIVDIESLPFGLGYQEKKAELKNIQDVTTSRLKFLNVLLDYGNVDSRVAGNASAFTFTNVAHPRIVADEIAERIETIKIRASESSNRDQTRSIVDAIVAYHRLMMAERHQGAPDPSAQLFNLDTALDNALTGVPIPIASGLPASDELSAPYNSAPSPEDFESEFPSESDLTA